MDRKKKKQYERGRGVFCPFPNRMRKVSLKTIAGSDQKRKYIGQSKHFVWLALKVLVLISAASVADFKVCRN